MHLPNAVFYFEKYFYFEDLLDYIEGVTVQLDIDHLQLSHKIDRVSACYFASGLSDTMANIGAKKEVGSDLHCFIHFCCQYKPGLTFEI